MSIDKREMPLKVLEEIERYSKRTSDLIKIANKEGVLLRYVDNFEEPSHYFEFNNFKNSNGKNFLTLSIKPSTEADPTGMNITVEVGKVEPHFKMWIGLLERYKKVDLFEDKILNGFQEQYFSEFEIIEDKDSEKPLTGRQILALEEYLESVESKLEDFRTESNSELIDEIGEQSKEIRENLTTKSRKWLLGKISWMWAKMTKAGTPLIKEFLTEVKKKGIIEMASQTIKLIEENLDKL